MQRLELVSREDGMNNVLKAIFSAIIQTERAFLPFQSFFKLGRSSGNVSFSSESTELTCNTKVTRRRGSNPPTLYLALGRPIA